LLSTFPAHKSSRPPPSLCISLLSFSMHPSSLIGEGDWVGAAFPTQKSSHRPLLYASLPSPSLSLCISPLSFSMHLSSLIGEGDWDGATGLDRLPLRASLRFFLCRCVVVAPKRSEGKIGEEKKGDFLN